MSSDMEMMRRAIDLAGRGRGVAEPNPMAGCVIVKDGRVIGEGYYEKFGGRHAEVNALAACRTDPAGATAYVSLEPCCDYKNKKTPPCTKALIAAGVVRVLAASVDPNPMVCGHGLEELRRAGIAAEEGLLSAEAKQLNAAFFKQITRGEPYVTLKWAQTADGKIAGAGGRRLAISNSRSLKMMHGLRGRCDAILIGIGTVLGDDPLLTAREADGPRVPLRIVLDSYLRIGVDSQLIKTARQFPLLICHGESANGDRAHALEKLGAEMIVLPSDGDGKLSLKHLLGELGKRGLTHLLVEPGRRVADRFLGENLADRVWIFRSPKRAEAPDGLAAAEVRYLKTGNVLLDGDDLSEYLNADSLVFYSSEPSADLVLARARSLRA